MKLGLRAKSALAVCLSMAAVLALAVLAGERALRSIEEKLGTAYARNFTLYNKQRILAPVAREVALSEQFSKSVLTRRFIEKESDPTARRDFFEEASVYQQSFVDKSYFVISALSRNYYFNDHEHKWSDQPRYHLDPKAAADEWFFKSMASTETYNLNVDYDVKLKLTKVWINVIVRSVNQKIGIAGTGLELSGFLKQYMSGSEPGVTPMILDVNGNIQAHPRTELIDYSSINDKGAQHKTVFGLLHSVSDQDAMRSAIQEATADAAHIPTFWANLDGRRQLFAVSYVPDLKWCVVTAVDLDSAHVFDRSAFLPYAAGGAALLTLLLGAVLLAVNRILLRPLLRLTNSVREVGSGNYDIALPPAANDELGELTTAFGTMAAQVRSHTDELETKVQERTQELVTVNREMAAAHKQIGDSIQYASLIQGAILPDRELAQALGGGYFVLWRPRDVVGGDFYVFRSAPGGCLLGVVDCAGHGVPGAFMTMIAHAAINVAIDTLGPQDPAALLTQVDERVRAMLHTTPQYAQVATNMDAGLAWVDFEKGEVIFAGAKISLYWCDGSEVGEIKGGRHSIGGKRTPSFQNQTLELDARKTFYLTTDGLLDQAGGTRGFGFGQERFTALMRRHAALPVADQQQAFDAELEDYRGSLPQRDDITVFCFRFAGSPAP
jgi:serine phosphatase RsbU (regulator of sigma subunit)